MKKLEEDVMEGAAEDFLQLMRAFKEAIGSAGLAGSPRFGAWDVDFGCGKPEEVYRVGIGKFDCRSTRGRAFHSHEKIWHLNAPAS